MQSLQASLLNHHPQAQCTWKIRSQTMPNHSQSVMEKAMPNTTQQHVLVMMA
jgi:hypothetical protein